MTSETATQTIQLLQRNADQARADALHEIRAAIQRLEVAWNDVNEGRATYYRHGVIDSSRVDTATALAALSVESLNNTRDMLKALGE